jgi:two-component system OmpR family sensor kinase
VNLARLTLHGLPRVAPHRARHPDDVLVRRATVRMGIMAGLGAGVIVAVLTTAALLVLLHNQQAAASTLLADTVQHADDAVDPPSGMWLAFQEGDGVSVSPRLPPGLPVRAAMDEVRRTGAADIREVALDGTRFRIRTESRGTAIVQAGLDLQSARVQSISVLRVLLLLGGVGLALAALAGAWVGRRAVRPLASALALQRRFVADASHELRTPVTLLRTRAQLVRRSMRDSSSTKLLAEVDGLVGDTTQLSAILDDLLLAADSREDTRTVVDLVELTQEITASCASHASDGKIRISCVPGPPARVLGSPVALRRALTALLDNAVRHAHATVRLSAVHTRNHVVVDVHDDGPGIDPGIEPRLFDRFASMPASGSAGPRRYGLGLALVSDITARHNGTVTAIRSDRHGATIRLTLPAAPVRSGHTG